MNEFDEYIVEMKKAGKSENTVRSYVTAFTHPDFGFFVFFKIQTLTDLRKIKQKDIRNYRNFLVDRGLSPSSVNSRIRPISAFLHWLKKNEYITKVATEDLEAMKEPDNVPVYLSDEETYRMIENCETLQEKVMVALMLATGMRVCEIVAVKKSDIRDGYITINGKGKHQRELAIHPSVMTLLNGYLENHPCDNLFYSMKGDAHELTTDAIRLRIKKAAQLAGIDPERIEKITPHKLRHTLATNLVSRGIDIRVIQAILGHASIDTTTRYAHVRNNTMANALTNTKLW